MMIDIVDFNTGMVLKEQASSRAEAIEWINTTFAAYEWSIKEEDEYGIYIVLPATRANVPGYLRRY